MVSQDQEVSKERQELLVRQELLDLRGTWAQLVILVPQGMMVL